MGSVLPTVIIVLAEIIVILAIALGAAVFLHVRAGRRHRSELNAVMGIARHAERSAPARHGHTPPAGANRTQPSAAIPPPNPVEAEFTARTNQSIGEIRAAIARLDAKLGQFHHEEKLHDKDLDHKIKEEDTHIEAMRRELHDANAALHELKAQYAALSQDLHNLRVEIEHHAPHNAPAAGVKAEAMPAASAPRSAPAAAAMPAAEPAHHADTTLIDDFTLPDAVLEELEEVAKSAAEKPAAHAAAAMASTAAAAKPVPATAQKSEPPRAPATAQATAGVVKKGTVDEPQYAFDAAQIEDLFNVPLFIPGAANAGINVEELNFDDMNLDDPHGAADSSHEQPHYDAERVFYQASEPSGIKPGWYFTLRGGKTHGPFGTREAGTRVLNEMIEQFKRTGDTGGR